MARPSKLTEKQWSEIAERMAAGESVRALAREFGVSEAAIRLRLSAQVEKIKVVANQIVATDVALKSLPVSAQITAHNLADQLRAMSGHIAGAAVFGAATAHRLAGIAHAQVGKIDDADPMESQEAIQAVSALTKVSNDAMQPALALLKINQDSMREPPPDAQDMARMSQAEFRQIAKQISSEI